MNCSLCRTEPARVYTLDQDVQAFCSECAEKVARAFAAVSTFEPTKRSEP